MRKSIFNPLKKLLGDNIDHRKFTHSLLGMFIIAIILTIYLFILSLIGLLILFIPLIYDIFTFNIILLLELVEKGQIDHTYFFTFLYASETAFLFGFFFHLWIDWPTAQKVPWVRFWKKSEMDGYVHTKTRNERRARHIFLIPVIVVISLEFLFIRNIPSYIFSLSAVGIFFVSGLLLRFTPLARLILLTKPCPVCERGLVTLKIGRDQKEIYACSNYRKGCSFKPQEVNVKNDVSYTEEPRKVINFLTLAFGFLLFMGVFVNNIFIPIGVIVFLIDVLLELKRVQFVKFWKVKE